MLLKLSEIAQILGLVLQGNDVEIVGVNTLQAAKPNEISFLSNPKYTHQLASTQAGAVILSKEHAHAIPRALISDEPYKDFGKALSLFAKPQGCFSGISQQAYIHPEAIVASTTTIYPYVFVGARAIIDERVILFPGVYIGEDCRIGEGSILYPHAVLMANTSIGKNCIIHPGAVIGSDGFGFAPSPMGIQKIPQVGNVTLKDNVEVGANTTIDRATLGTTGIGDNTKIDNLVQIAHGVNVGKNTFLVSQVGVSGSTQIGDHCTIAGQTGIAGHLTIGNNVTLGPQSGVAHSIPDNKTMGGSPTVDRNTYLRTLSLMPRFPELFKRITKIEKLLATKQDGHIQE